MTAAEIVPANAAALINSGRGGNRMTAPMSAAPIAGDGAAPNPQQPGRDR